MDKCYNKCNCNPQEPVKGNFVPLIQNKIDLASSTNVNNPIIPKKKPAECLLKNKKYQVIIGFNNDINGEVWPEWMKKPTLHALGIDALIDNTSAFLSAITDTVLINVVRPTMLSIDNRVTELSTKYTSFIQTPATSETLGVVKGSNEVNKSSILSDGTMEVNGLEISRLSQDVELRLYSRSIAETMQD